MVAVRNKDIIPEQHKELQFFADLSQYMLQKRRSLNTICKALRNHNIAYKWGFSTKLIITKEGKDYIVNSLSKGLDLLKSWLIILEDTPRASNNEDPSRITDDWQ